jgi:hypothetical protein
MLAIAAIHLYSKNYFVLKDYYTGVLALKTTYESAEMIIWNWIVAQQN